MTAAESSSGGSGNAGRPDVEVRTHLRHIYAKLDGHSRAEAVNRGRQLGLPAPASRLSRRRSLLAAAQTAVSSRRR